MPPRANAANIKVIVLGEGGVGKSAITIQFTSHEFTADYDPTIEDAYRVQTEVDGHAVELDILDTAGQEVFSAVRDQYMRDGEGFLLIFSLAAKSSFAAITDFYEHIHQVKDEDEDVPIVLLGNKCDLVDEREVSAEDLQELAKEFNCPFFETSALERINIDESFHQLVRLVWTYNRHHQPAARKDEQCKPKCCVLL